MAATISLGKNEKGDALLLDVTELLSTRLLVQGNSGSGKSHLLRRLLEQTATMIQQIVIDPEGDFVSLSPRYGHVVVDATGQSEPALSLAGERVRTHRAPVIFNIEALDLEQQLRAVGAFLGGLFNAPRADWYPALVVVDEAQLFAPMAGGDTSDEARRSALTAMTNLMCRGRKRGLAGVIATQRLAKLAKNVAAEASNFLMGRTFLDIDMARAADLLGMERRTADAFRDLARGQFMALGPALSRRPVKVTIGAVETLSHAIGPELIPFPIGSTLDVDDLFTQPDLPLTPRARDVRPLADIASMLSSYSPPKVAEIEAIQGEEMRADLVLRLVVEISSDPVASSRSIEAMYHDFLFRARREGVDARAVDLREFTLNWASSQVGGVEEDPKSAEWNEIREIIRDLPEDVMGVVFLLAFSAVRERTCPDDEAIARAYSTHSMARARRQISYLEERNIIAVHRFGKLRQVAFVGRGWQTALGPC